jgi:hypothetical protein
MSTDKPSQNEDEYFARLDAEIIKKQQAERLKAATAAERKSHYMRCPKCGADLETIERHGVSIDRCNECGGVWLDNGELDLILQHADPGFFGRVFGNFLGRGKSAT